MISEFYGRLAEKLALKLSQKYADVSESRVNLRRYNPQPLESAVLVLQSAASCLSQTTLLSNCLVLASIS